MPCGAGARFEERSAFERCQFRQAPGQELTKTGTVEWCNLWKLTGSLKRLIALYIVFPWSFTRIGEHGTVQLISSGRLLQLTVLVSVAGSSLTLIKLFRVSYISKLSRESVHLSMGMPKKS
jgi:hypothetical protein